jgi:transcriptional regulator with XRE-family HTH domain
MNLTDMGAKIREKRREIGLGQEQLAKLAGLSRVTINQLENGALDDLGYAKLMSILGILGLDCETTTANGLKNALTIAARTASTSYKDTLSAVTLARILRTGEAPLKYQPHLMVLLDETPLAIVVGAVKEASGSVPAKEIMRHLANWAKEWKTNRQAWV